MSVFTRAATLADIRQMAEIAGHSVTAGSLADWMDVDSAYSAWHLVEDEVGRLLGFQHVGHSEALPADACEIASFFARIALPPGASTKLFETTAETARLLRYTWISASLATDNEAARVYYQTQGFRPYDQSLTHLKMRFDLD